MQWNYKIHKYRYNISVHSWRMLEKGLDKMKQQQKQREEWVQS